MCGAVVPRPPVRKYIKDEGTKRSGLYGTTVDRSRKA